MKFWSDSATIRVVVVVLIFFILFLVLMVILWTLPFGRINYSENFQEIVATTTSEKPAFVVTHIYTPEPVKAVYMTSWAAGSGKFREELFDLIDNTEINAVVIDIKDYTGRVSFITDDPVLESFGSTEKRIPDIKEFIGKLHEKGAYVIGRISVFQDSYLVTKHPEWAVKTKIGENWKDRKGIMWLDAGAKPVWDYIAIIGEQAYKVGFDELNFDYIRFPSDGNMQDITYVWSNGRERTEVMREFFSFLSDRFFQLGIPISADFFGLVTSATGDLGIGQVLEDALPYFDFVAPMVYPSHFGYGFNGIARPAEYPYEVVKYSMDKAVAKVISATSTPSKLRPWLQSFDLGAKYTPAMVRAQIQATYDAGLNSWMLWNAGSVYNKDSLE